MMSSSSSILEAAIVAKLRFLSVSQAEKSMLESR